jgi:branched-chain amino acid transport system permease protein
MELGQLLVIGIAMGFIYGLIAMGFVLIYKASGVFNFAQSQLVMVGAWFLWSLLMWANMPLGVALVLTVVLAGLLGWVVQRLFLMPLAGQPLFSLVMITIALSAGFDGLVVSIWGGPMKTYPFALPSPESIALGPLQIGTEYIWIVGLCGASLAIFFAFFKFTRLGLGMRAASDNQRIGLSCGIPLSGVFAWAWILSAVLAAVAGIFMGLRVGLTTQLANIGLKVLPVVLLGGLESLAGAVIGGIIIGVAEVIAGAYLDPLVGGGLKDLFPFIIMIIILFVRPQGLFGWKIIERV